MIKLIASIVRNGKRNNPGITPGRPLASRTSQNKNTTERGDVIPRSLYFFLKGCSK